MSRSTLLVLLALSAPCVLHAQRLDTMPTVPRATVGLGYTFLHANAPPGGSDGFTAHGGFASVGVNANSWLGAAVEFHGVHTKNISTYGQDLTLFSILAGPRVTLRQPRTEEFGQVLFGAALGRDSYFPQNNSYTTSATSFAFSAGGGLDINLTRRFAVRIPEVQYLHTALPNGVNGSQNQMLLSAGLLIKFGSFSALHSKELPPPVHKKISMTCSANVRTLQPGETLEVTAMTRQPDGEDVTYAWTSDAMPIQGTGGNVTIDTTGLQPGHYHLTGHAMLVSDGMATAACDVPFRIQPAPKAMLPPPPPPPAPEAADREFHQNVRDVYFDYDKSDLKPDQQTALNDAVAYLQAHPRLRVMIGGYSDERGSVEYNIKLGLKRSNTVREALVNAGIDPSRVQVVSYGKGAQVCLTPKEDCYQRNRRAAFLMQP